MEHLLSVKDLSKEQLLELLGLAKDFKANPGKYAQALAGKSIVTIYEKESLRTRVTFDIGINKLGGHAVYLDSQNGAIGQRETVKDYAKNLSRWADGIVARVMSHKTLEGLAEHGSVPVINSLCDLYHPCQALADFLTISEYYDDITQVKLAYVGEGNNVTHSLLLAGAILGAEITAVCPKGSGPDAQIVKEAMELAAISGGKIDVTDDLDDIVGYDIVYGDTWVSMGDNTPLDAVKEKYMPYQINKALLKKTGIKHVMHCLPAHREYEITSEVMDSDQSLVFDQAENRMHAQNAVLLTLLK